MAAKGGHIDFMFLAAPLSGSARSATVDRQLSNPDKGFSTVLVNIQGARPPSLIELHLIDSTLYDYVINNVERKRLV